MTRPMHNIETSRPLVIGRPAGQGRAFSPTPRAVGVDGSSVEVVYARRSSIWFGLWSHGGSRALCLRAEFDAKWVPTPPPPREIS